MAPLSFRVSSGGGLEERRAVLCDGGEGAEVRPRGRDGAAAWPRAARRRVPQPALAAFASACAASATRELCGAHARPVLGAPSLDAAFPRVPRRDRRRVHHRVVSRHPRFGLSDGGHLAALDLVRLAVQHRLLPRQIIIPADRLYFPVSIFLLITIF